jgi:hypothetical protein
LIILLFQVVCNRRTWQLGRGWLCHMMTFSSCLSLYAVSNHLPILRIFHSEENRTMVLKLHMLCILKQQSNAKFNVSCSFEKTIISVNAFRFRNSQFTWISKIYGKDKIL